VQLESELGYQLTETPTGEEVSIHNVGRRGATTAAMPQMKEATLGRESDN